MIIERIRLGKIDWNKLSSVNRNSYLFRLHKAYYKQVEVMSITHVYLYSWWIHYLCFLPTNNLNFTSFTLSCLSTDNQNPTQLRETCIF